MTPVRRGDEEGTDRLSIEFFRSTKASSNSTFRSVKASTPLAKRRCPVSQSGNGPSDPAVSQQETAARFVKGPNRKSTTESPPLHRIDNAAVPVGTSGSNAVHGVLSFLEIAVQPLSVAPASECVREFTIG